MLHMGDRYTQEQFDELFRNAFNIPKHVLSLVMFSITLFCKIMIACLRDVPLDAEGKFDYRDMARMMKYGNPEAF